MSELYYRHVSSLNQEQNANLQCHYLALNDKPETQKTHFFEGRFENIYIEIDRVPGLQILMQETLGFASSNLVSELSSLKTGFWFNEMHQGHRTTAHTHDEDDLLSAVYYINVPNNSGDLILCDAELDDVTRITPDAGEYIFFAPNLLHSVETNQSDQMRLSIGMNIRPA